MKNNLILVLMSLFSLAGCVTYPIYGEVDGTEERFLGNATSNVDGGGTLSMMSSEGTNCKGSYSFPPSMNWDGATSGKGTFACDDGRKGGFSFAGSMNGGQGFGKMADGRKLVFYFGDIVHVKNH